MAPPDTRRTPRHLPAPPSNTARRPSATSPSRARGAPRMTSDDVLNIAYGIPTLEPPPDPRRPANNVVPGRNAASRQGHARSASQPFPSLFSNKKKLSDSVPGTLDSTDDESFNSSHQSPYKHSAAHTGSATERDLLQGRCMACNSGVRWPKNLSVFRCTICQTVNDLMPLKRQQDSGGMAITPIYTFIAHSIGLENTNRKQSCRFLFNEQEVS